MSPARTTRRLPSAEADTLRVIPLGGLGEIGRNMTVFDLSGRLLVVDCGVLFPGEGQPGVNVILPDFTAIADRLDDIEAIVLTHGHEDHIGGVPHLLKLKPDIALVGSQLTLALVEAKLAEHHIRPYTLEVAAGNSEKLGPFECEFFAVNHSIPDGLAIAITTAAGVVLHTGDFKMDQLPLDGRLTDLSAFARLGERGVDLLLIDSTNADVPGFTVPERDIAPAIDEVFTNAPGRIVVTSFASHVHRIQQVLDAADRHGRRAAYIGRSMQRNMTLAAELGYLHHRPDLLADSRKLDDIPDNNLVLICTGSQGEPMAALSRMANGTRHVHIGPKDTVLMASSLIPGNETPVYRVINGLTRLGATVVHKGNAVVHVSGHASAGELLYCYNVIRPRNVLPVHGEARHLAANAALARRSGVPAERIVIADVGDIVELAHGQVTIAGTVPAELVYVDGDGTVVSDRALKDRLALATDGFVSVVAVIDAASGDIVGPPRIDSRGIAGTETTATLEALILEALADAASGGPPVADELERVLHRTVTRWARTRLRRRPVVSAVVILA